MSKRRSKKKKPTEAARERAQVPRKFLVDEDVPHAVVRYLYERGHEVLEVRTELGPSTPDRKVADWADDIGATVVTCNVGDYERLIFRQPPEQKRRDEDTSITRWRAGALFLGCGQQQARTRLEAQIDLVEFEFVRAARFADLRVIVKLGKHIVIVHR